MAMIMQRYLMPKTGAYETVKSIHLRMYGNSAHLLEYRSYLFFQYLVS